VFSRPFLPGAFIAGGGATFWLRKGGGAHGIRGGRCFRPRGRGRLSVFSSAEKGEAAAFGARWALFQRHRPLGAKPFGNHRDCRGCGLGIPGLVFLVVFLPGLFPWLSLGGGKPANWRAKRKSPAFFLWQHPQTSISLASAQGRRLLRGEGPPPGGLLTAPPTPDITWPFHFHSLGHWKLAPSPVGAGPGTPPVGAAGFFWWGTGRGPVWDYRLSREQPLWAGSTHRSFVLFFVSSWRRLQRGGGGRMTLLPESYPRAHRGPFCCCSGGLFFFLSVPAGEPIGVRNSSGGCSSPGAISPTAIGLPVRRAFSPGARAVVGLSPVNRDIGGTQGHPAAGREEK